LDTPYVLSDWTYAAAANLDDSRHLPPECVNDIDARPGPGPGYAKAHPELIAAYMHTAAADFGQASLSKAMGGVVEILAATLRGYSRREETWISFAADRRSAEFQAPREGLETKSARSPPPRTRSGPQPMAATDVQKIFSHRVRRLKRKRHSQPSPRTARWPDVKVMPT
jgi:hypothetical protein